MRQFSQQSKRKLLLYAALLAVAIGFMVTLRVCSRSIASSASAFIKSGGDTIDVAIEYSPMSLYSYSDTLGGFNYDLLRRIARDENLRIKYHPVANVAQALGMLEEGKVEMVIASLPPGDSLQSRFLITEPTFISHQVLIRHRDSEADGDASLRSQTELAGCSIHVSEESPAILRLKNLSDEIGDTIYIVEDKEVGNEQLFLMVAAGDIDIAVVNNSLARRMLPLHPNVGIVTDISLSQFQSWVITPSRRDLLSTIDSAIVRLKSTPFFNQLADRYEQTSPNVSGRLAK